MLLATLLIVVVAATTNVFPFRQILAQRQRVEVAAQQLAALEEENAQLESEKQALQSPLEVERIARENLGYVRPGEVSYVVVAPPEAPVPEDGAAVEEAVGGRSWYGRIWDFLTGRDLASSGPAP